MRHAPPTALTSAGVAAAALAALLLTGCSGSHTAARSGPSATAGSTPAPSVAPSGDPDLDSLDTDLSAFAQENQGLDQAVVATKEG